MNYINEENKLKSLVSSDTWDLLKENKAIIAGGAITSLFCSRDINDIDVYFQCEEDFENFITEVFDGSFSLICHHITDRSILFQDKYTKQDVQVIYYRWHNNLVSLFTSFDYTVNMAAYDFEDFHFHADFMKHNSQRYLSFNSGTDYPLISALRVQKYREKGYTISKTQMLSVILAGLALQINSWEELKDHIGGMYGLEMDKVFDETKPFNFQDAINTLQALSADHKFQSDRREIEMDVVFDTMYSKTERLEPEKVFINCYQDKDGAYLYRYPINARINVGEEFEPKGAYLTDKCGDALTVEVEVLPSGKYLAKNVYSPLEFYKRFKRNA